MAVIKDYPLSKLEDFLVHAKEKEMHSEWITLYPFMVCGFTDYMSFEQYKDKVIPKIEAYNDMSNQQIEDSMKKIIKSYETRGE